MFSALHQYCTDGEIRKNVMGWVCGMREGEDKCVQGFGMETWRKETFWKT